MEQGSLYAALYRLEEQGWISSQWGTSENNRRARFYKPTSAAGNLPHGKMWLLVDFVAGAAV